MCLLQTTNDDADFTKLKDELTSKDGINNELENKVLCLEETVRSLQSGESSLEKHGKTYPLDVRMLVYHAVVSNVPTNIVPAMVQKFARRAGINLDTVPQRTTVD